MVITVTIKVSPESRGELIDSFGANYRTLREHIEGLVVQGILPQARYRWLLDSGQWTAVDSPIKS